jgi:hypothetical protein
MEVSFKWVVKSFVMCWSPFSAGRLYTNEERRSPGNAEVFKIARSGYLFLLETKFRRHWLPRAARLSGPNFEQNPNPRKGRILPNKLDPTPLKSRATP